MHTATTSLDWIFRSGTELSLVTRFKSGVCKQAQPGLSSIQMCSEADGYTFLDGSPYAGAVQTRYLAYYDANYKDWMTTVRLGGKSGRASVWSMMPSGALQPTT